METATQKKRITLSRAQTIELTDRIRTYSPHIIEARLGSLCGGGVVRGYFQDMVGKKIGKLLVVSRAPNDKKNARWNCACDCGNTVVVSTGNLGKTTNSCGCLHAEFVAKKIRRHGMSKSSIHGIWRKMLGRCSNNPKNPSYRNYYGRGIRVCDRWMTFENFYADMGDPPEGMSLDRINNDGNYSPDNCRWPVEKALTTPLRAQKSHG